MYFKKSMILYLSLIHISGLGNGGLGRLAACFIESAATMDMPLVGYGIRYSNGLFKQNIENGFQTECEDNPLLYLIP